MQNRERIPSQQRPLIRRIQARLILAGDAPSDNGRVKQHASGSGMVGARCQAESPQRGKVFDALGGAGSGLETDEVPVVSVSCQMERDGELVQTICDG